MVNRLVDLFSRIARFWSFFLVLLNQPSFDVFRNED